MVAATDSRHFAASRPHYRFRPCAPGPKTCRASMAPMNASHGQLDGVAFTSSAQCRAASQQLGISLEFPERPSRDKRSYRLHRNAHRAKAESYFNRTHARRWAPRRQHRSSAPESSEPGGRDRGCANTEAPPAPNIADRSPSWTACRDVSSLAVNVLASGCRPLNWPPRCDRRRRRRVLEGGVESFRASSRNEPQ